MLFGALITNVAVTGRRNCGLSGSMINIVKTAEVIKNIGKKAF